MPGRIGAAWDGLTIDPVAFEKEQDRLVRGVLGAATGAVRDTTKGLERDLEALTKAAVKGKAWRAWSSQPYPKTGIAREPTGEVYLNGRDRTYGLLDFFTKSGRIKGKRDQWLAIPTKAAGSRGRSRMLTPGEWERQNGVRLRFVYRRNKPGLLVADMGTTNARTGTFRKISRKRTAFDMRERPGMVRGAQTVIIFVLVPYVQFANSFAIEPKLDASPGALMREFVERVRALP